MKKLICETCGGPIEISEDGVHARCLSCGNTYEYRSPKDEYLIELMNEANDNRLHNEFDEAIKKYRLIINSNKRDAEAHWGLLLAKYGISYEIDPITNAFVPTFHRNTRGNILENPSAINAVNLASEGQRARYKEELDELRHIQEGIEAYARSSEQYDVFISFKATDINEYNLPVKTIDRDIAYNIYDELTQNGVRAFFSEVSLKDSVAKDYEALIFNALNTCKVFILVGTSVDHINAVWVKNEWTRYRERIAEDQKNGTYNSSHFAVIGGNLQPSELPPLFMRTQNVMLNSYAGDSYKKDITRSVLQLLGRDNKREDKKTITMSEDDLNAMIAKMMKSQSSANVNETAVPITPVVPAAPVAVSVPRQVETGMYDVVLDAIDSDKKIQTIMSVKKVLGYGLKDARDFVEGCPNTIMKSVDKAKVDEIKAEFEATNATIKVIPIYETVMEDVGTHQTAQPVEEKYTVILKSAGSSVVGACRVVKDVKGMSILEAKRFVDQLPQVLKKSVTKSEAEDVARQCEAEGALAELIKD